VTALERRAEEFRARQIVRAWEFRQLRGSKGTWYRLRLLLAKSREAYAIDDETFAELAREGLRSSPVGDELEPPRRYVVVSSDRARRLDGAVPVRVALSSEFLAAANVVLVPFETSDS
jgi:hypothetical protein